MNPVYDLQIRLSWQAPGFGTGVALAMQQLRGLTTSIGEAERGMQAYQRLTAQLAAAGAPTGGALAGLAQQGQALQGYQRQVESTNASLSQLVGGGLITAGALGIVGVLKPAINTAAQWQQALVLVGQATTTTGETSRQAAQDLQNLNTAAIALSGPRMFSATQVFQAERTAATSGINDRRTLLNALPQLLNVAEIDQHQRGIPIDESVRASVELAHMFQRWPTKTADIPAFNAMLDTFARSQLVSGMSPSQSVTALSYLAPAAQAFHLKPEDVMSFTALAANAGVLAGGRGGAGLANVFYALAPALGHRTSMRNTSMAALMRAGGTTWGALTSEPSDRFIPDLLNTVMKAMASLHGPNAQVQRLSLLRTAFGVSALRALAPLTTDAAATRDASIRHAINGGPGGLLGGAAMQAQLNQTVTGQGITAQTTLSNIGGIFATQMLPTVLTLLQAVNAVLGAIVDFGMAHSGLMQVAGDVALAAVAVGLIVGPLTMAAGALGLLQLALEAVDLKLVPVLVSAGLLTVVVAGALLVWQNWSTIMDAFSGRFGVLIQFFSVFGATITVSLLAIRAWAAMQAVAATATTLFSGGVGLLGLAFGALDIAMLPVTLIILGIAAAVAAIVVVWTHWDDIMRTLHSHLGPFGAALVVAFTPILAAVEGVKLLIQAWQWVQSMFNSAGQRRAGPDPGAYHQGQVQATRPGDGTVGLRSSTTGLPGGGTLPPRGQWPTPPPFPRGYHPPLAAHPAPGSRLIGPPAPRLIGPPAALLARPAPHVTRTPAPVPRIGPPVAPPPGPRRGAATRDATGVGAAPGAPVGQGATTVVQAGAIQLHIYPAPHQSPVEIGQAAAATANDHLIALTAHGRHEVRRGSPTGHGSTGHHGHTSLRVPGH